MMDKNKLMELINIIKKETIDDINIINIINEYRSYPQYIIKYITVKYPKNTADHAIKYILNTSERRCELIDCILSSYSIKLCEIQNMKDIVSNDICKNECKCDSRECWSYIYLIFMDILTDNPELFLQSYNLSYSLTSLISKTDVIDEKLFMFVSTLAKNPKNWKNIISFIKEAELYSSDYGDIIIMMRDIILENDKLEDNKKNKLINNFQARAMLGSVIHKYNELQKNISKITDNIYLSNIEGTKNVAIIKDKNINYIVTITKRPVFKIRGIGYTQIMIDDIGSVNFIEATLDTVDMVIKYIKNNYVVLVHCYKGLSRSVCFVILLLIRIGIPFNEAYTMIQNARIYIEPNPEFIKQIEAFIEKN
jgi:hypothetical protein